MATVENLWIDTKKEQKSYRAIDLFAGIGGAYAKDLKMHLTSIYLQFLLANGIPMLKLLIVLIMQSLTLQEILQKYLLAIFQPLTFA